LGIIKRTIRFKDTRVMLSLYKILVEPHVEYCSSAWKSKLYKRKLPKATVVAFGSFQ